MRVAPGGRVPTDADLNVDHAIIKALATPVTSQRVMRPTWVEVSLTALQHNFRTIHRYVAPQATVCCVVKADAYGHGAVECARTLEEAGASWFAVTSTDEGVALRKAGVNGRILLLTGFWRGDEDEAVLHDLTPAVWAWWQIAALEEAYTGLGWRVQGKIPIHLKLDTGMSRLGLQPKDLPKFLSALQRARRVELEGVFSHLASSEVIDAPSVDEQVNCFDQCVAEIRAAGQHPAYCHIGNSAALITRPRTWYDMVRPGLALYGYFLPPTAMDGSSPPPAHTLPVRPVLSWKTQIIAVKDVPAGAPIGYGGAYVTRGPSRIAILAVGYADGLSRMLSSKGRVIVRDQYANIIGNVAMDLTVVDVTHIPGARVADVVTIIGSTEHCTISAWEHADLTQTIPYEVLCSIGRRVPRVYVE